MIIIGLTGGSGAGKGEVSRLYQSRGIPSVDTDMVYRRLTQAPSACTKELAARFGDFILGQNGELDRKRLAEIVFCGGEEQRTALADLNRITHKHILRSCRISLTHMQKRGVNACIIDAPLLFESGFDKECDVVISVIADRELRISRIMMRDFLTRAAATARINAQQNDSFYIERSDYVIHNNGSVQELSAKADSIIKKIFADKGLTM